MYCSAIKIKSNNGYFLSTTQSNQQGWVEEQKEPLSPVITALSLCLWNTLQSLKLLQEGTRKRRILHRNCP